MANEEQCSNGLEDAEPELDLLNVLLKAEDDQSEEDENSTEANIDQLAVDDEIFGPVFKQMQSFINQSDEELCTNDMITLEWNILNDFLNLIEKHQANLTDEYLSIIRKGFSVFFEATDSLYWFHSSSTCSSDAMKEIFYMFLNLINLQIIQNYLKNIQMPDELKLICRYASREIFRVTEWTYYLTTLTLNDNQRLSNTIQLLSIMIDYVHRDLESSNLSVDPMPDDPSITRWNILRFLTDYSYRMVLVRDLIEAGCLQMLIGGLKKICRLVYFQKRHNRLHC